MIKLVPMKEADFEPFMTLSMKDQAEGHVREGRWAAEEAETIMLQLRGQLLPQGLQTSGHFFFTLETEDSTQKVGSLWFNMDEYMGEKAIFVMDIQINPRHRRKGYGMEAFLLLEEQAHKMGINVITLHVFNDNTPALALYQKLGYTGPCELMVKNI